MPYPSFPGHNTANCTLPDTIFSGQNILASTKYRCFTYFSHYLASKLRLRIVRPAIGMSENPKSVKMIFGTGNNLKVIQAIISLYAVFVIYSKPIWDAQEGFNYNAVPASINLSPISLEQNIAISIATVNDWLPKFAIPANIAHRADFIQREIEYSRPNFTFHHCSVLLFYQQDSMKAPCQG